MADQETVDRGVSELLRLRSSDALGAPAANNYAAQGPLNNNNIFNPNGALPVGTASLPSSAWPPPQQGDANVVDLTSDYIPPQEYQNYAPSFPQPGHLQHPGYSGAAAPGMHYPLPQQQQQQQGQYIGQPQSSLFGGDPAFALQAALAQHDASLPPSLLQVLNGPPQQQQQQDPLQQHYPQQQMPMQPPTHFPSIYPPPSLVQQLLNSNPMMLSQQHSEDYQGGGSGRGWNASQMLQQQRQAGESGSLFPQSLTSRIITSGTGPRQHQQQHQQGQMPPPDFLMQNINAIAPLLQQQLIREAQARRFAELSAQRDAGNYQGPYRPTSSFVAPQQPTRNTGEALQAALAALQTVGAEGEMQPPVVSYY